MYYRVYLLDHTNRIRAAESFLASDDAEAMLMAGMVHDACCDVFPAFELWRGGVRLACGPGKRLASLAHEIDRLRAARQGTILELEDRLQRTFACVNRSRKLLEASSRLRTG